MARRPGPAHTSTPTRMLLGPPHLPRGLSASLNSPKMWEGISFTLILT